MIIVRGESGGGRTDGRREARRSQDEGTGEWLVLTVVKVRGSDPGSASAPLVENTPQIQKSRSEMASAFLRKRRKLITTMFSELLSRV